MSKKPTIAAGAVAAGGSGAMGAVRYTSRDIDAAMSSAIKQAHAQGITDPADIRTLMQAARRAVVSGE